MPTYVYKCNQCEQHFEYKQKFRDEPLSICKECGGLLKKVLALPAVHYKGKGFYSTSGNGDTDEDT